jgi:N-methylhydantoinase A
MGFKVGPESAGSDPGPVCYGHGGVYPTVTDADVVLGYLNPDCFYRGKMKLDKEASFKAIEEKIAKPMGISTVHAASGIYDVINSYMTDNLHQAVIEKGFDPRDFTVVGYGGNGPMHIGVYAKELGAVKAVVPFHAPVFSAFGIASSDIVRVYRRTKFFQMPANPDDLNAVFQEMESAAIEEMLKEGIKKQEIELYREVELRYNRQVHEVGISVPGGEITKSSILSLMETWENKYDSLYGKGSGLKEAGIQLVNFRVTATARYFKPTIRSQKAPAGSNASASVKGERPVFFKKFDDYVKTPIYDFARIHLGEEIKGPAIIESELTTIVVHPDQAVVLDKFNNIVFNKL